MSAAEIEGNQTSFGATSAIYRSIQRDEIAFVSDGHNDQSIRIDLHLALTEIAADDNDFMSL